jgi:2,3-bisphosphoglycerate-dependent phosphoglycerate mutase
MWNWENRFTGWADVALSETGVVEAQRAADLLLEHGLSFDVAFTSVLQRAIKTLWIVLERMDRMWIPTFASWRLNERHYGALQGLNKSETAARHGVQQTHLWRRSYDVRPPALAPDDARNPARDPRYARVPPGELPLTESLKDTVARVLPYWNGVIVPALRRGERVLIAAHGNSLRALVMHLEALSAEDIAETNIPTGIPLVYDLSDRLKPVGGRYLGNTATVMAGRCPQAREEMTRADLHSNIQ